MEPCIPESFLAEGSRKLVLFPVPSATYRGMRRRWRGRGIPHTMKGCRDVGQCMNLDARGAHFPMPLRHLAFALPMLRGGQLHESKDSKPYDSVPEPTGTRARSICSNPTAAHGRARGC